MLNLFESAAREADDPETRAHPDDQRAEDLAAEIRDVIAEQLGRGGVWEDCVTIDVRRVGSASDGRTIFVGMLRLHRWEPISALRLLLGLPLLQSKVRKAVRHSWLHEVACFNGLWAHPSGQFEEPAVMTDVRQMIKTLERSMPRVQEDPTVPMSSVWSVPADLPPDTH